MVAAVALCLALYMLHIIVVQPGSYHHVNVAGIATISIASTIHVCPLSLSLSPSIRQILLFYDFFVIFDDCTNRWLDFSYRIFA